MTDANPTRGGEGDRPEEGGDAIRKSTPAASSDRPTSGRSSLLRALGGLFALGSLAGCAADDDRDRPTDLVETEAGTPPGGWNTPTESELSDEECRDGIADIEETFWATHERRQRLERQIESTERTLELLKLSRDRWKAFGDDVVADAEVVADEVRPAVVFVEIDSVAGHGTGWYVDEHHILTNAHVVSGAAVSAWTFEEEEREVTIVDYVEDLMPDVAVLETEEPAPATLSVDPKRELESGEPLVMVGHPGGVGNWVGTLGAYKKTLSPDENPNVTGASVVTTVPSSGGSSGSPVVTLDGTVVGMHTGGGDVQYRSTDQPPIPALERVYDRSLPTEELSMNVPIEEAIERYERLV